MRIGTIGFVGANLTKAREARHITQASLARMIDVSRTTISDYESDRKSPAPNKMERIQSVLNMPLSYFQRPIERLPQGAIFYRSMSAATKSARLSAETRFEWLKDIASYLKNFVNFPNVNFPSFDLPENPRKIGNELIEELANETRRFWGLGDGSISNVTWLLENNGGIVGRFPLEADTLDAFSEFNPVDRRPYIVLGDDKGVAVRSRFDAAHELAHLILHRRIDKTRITNPADFGLIEKQAHRFAGAFLFPAQSYLREVFIPDLDLFRNLKAKWRVSIQLQIQRGVDLGVIPQDQSVRFWKNCMRRGWKYREPLDDELEVEQPRIMRRALQMLIEENVQSRFDILATLPYSAGDIAELTGLPEMYLENKGDSVVSVISLKDFQAERGASSAPEDDKSAQNSGRIINFKQR